MRRFTTPSLTFEIDADLTGCDVYLTLRQGRTEITVSEFDNIDVLDGITTVTTTLTQRQTARFSERLPVEAMFNVVDPHGYRVPSDVVNIVMEKQLLNKEL